MAHSETLTTETTPRRKRTGEVRTQQPEPQVEAAALVEQVRAHASG